MFYSGKVVILISKETLRQKKKFRNKKQDKSPD